MSVNPVQYNDSDKTFSVIHSEHSGSVNISDIQFMLSPDGMEMYGTLALKCPECSAVSFHPIGGGSSPPEVQEMFTRIIAELGCPCGQIGANSPLSLAKSHTKKHCENMDFRGRWQLDGVPIT